MKTLFDLQAETILFSVAAMGYTSVQGVVNPFGSLTEAEIPALVNRAQRELLKNGCGKLDFDGNFSFSEEYCRAIEVCACVVPQLTFRVRQGKGLPRIATFFKKGESVYCLQSQADAHYTMQTGTAEETVEAQTRQMGLPSVQAQGKPFRADSDCLQYKTAREFEKAEYIEGTCNAETALTLANCLNGTGMRLAVITPKQNWQKNRELFFDENTILEKSMIYTVGEKPEDWQEQVLFEPIGAAQVKTRLTALLAGGTEVG